MTIFCLEAEWGDMRSRESVRPTLDMLDRLGYSHYVHRDVATVEELKHYLDRFSRAKASTYPLLYLAGHGDVGTFCLATKAEIDLDGLGLMLKGKLKDRVVYFGSCSIAKASDAKMANFANTTGARAVVGYEAEVDWLESSAFELLLLARITEEWRSDALFNQLVKRHRLWAKELGLVVATKKQVRRAKKL